MTIMTIHARMEWTREFLGKDFSLIFTATATVVAANIDTILSALPLLVTLVFQLYLKWKKHKRMEKQQNEIHMAILGNLKEGKPVPPELIKKINNDEELE